MKTTLSIYGSHDACAVFTSRNGKLKEIKWVKKF